MKSFKIFIYLGFLAIFLLLMFGFDETTTEANEKDYVRMKEAVEKVAITCYSIEGKYAKELQYLKDQYGLYIDEDRYQVHYEWIADNIRPTIHVFMKGGE